MSLLVFGRTGQVAMAWARRALSAHGSNFLKTMLSVGARDPGATEMSGAG